MPEGFPGQRLQEPQEYPPANDLSLRLQQEYDAANEQRKREKDIKARREEYETRQKARQGREAKDLHEGRENFQNIQNGKQMYQPHQREIHKWDLLARHTPTHQNAGHAIFDKGPDQ